MPHDLLTGASPKLTEKLLQDWTAHVNARDALDGLTPDEAATKRANRRPPELPPLEAI